MTYNRKTAIEAIKRINKRQSEKKDVVFQSAKEKRREERERKKREERERKKSINNKNLKQ
tara:strand:- start:2429 stop:2608 length:180 start_codon:yes stop_codon:yes gene_type:complete